MTGARSYSRMASSSLENLCQFTSQLELGEVDPSIISHARLVFVDTVGVITAGSTSDEVSKLPVQLSEKDESGESSCIDRRSPIEGSGRESGDGPASKV